MCQAQSAARRLDRAIRDAAACGDQAGALPAGIRAGACRRMDEIAAIAGIRRRPILTIPWRRWSGRAGCSPGSAMSSTCSPRRIRTRRSRRSSATWRHGSPATGTTLTERRLFARLDSLRRLRDRSVSPRSRRACWIATTRFRRAGAGLAAAAKAAAARSERLAELGTAFGQNRAGRRAVLDTAAWPRAISPACRISLPICAPPPRSGRKRAIGATGRRAADDGVALLSSRSCSARRGGTCARRCCGPGSPAATTATKTTTTPSSPRRCGCATSMPRMLGYPSFAAYKLEDSMAKTPEAVRGLLDRVWVKARARALADRDAMQELIAEEGGNFKLAAWDWRYYAEKLRQRAPTSTTARSSPICPGQHARRRLRHGAEAVRPLLHRAQRHPGLARRCPGLGGQAARRQPCGPVLSATTSRAPPNAPAPG